MLEEPADITNETLLKNKQVKLMILGAPGVGIFRLNN